MTAHSFREHGAFIVTGPAGDRTVYRCGRCGVLAVSKLGVRYRVHPRSRMPDYGDAVQGDCDIEIVRSVLTE